MRILPWLGLTMAVASTISISTTRADHSPSLYVEGYAGQVSYQPGDELQLHVSTTAPTFALEIARLGAERKVVFSQSGIPGLEHPIPENASSHGCSWPVGCSVPIPEDWTSGYYQVVFRAEDRGGTYVQRNRRTAIGEAFFIVRASQPGSNTKILLQLATNTYNAYNNWGGFSLYSYHARAKLQGHRVSFHRPPASQFGNWEHPFVTWAENAGYTIDYAANNDLEFRPELLEHYRLVLSIGHDEYWSAKMRDHLEQFIESGGNVAFLSGNTCCWQVRNEEEGVAQTCYKQNYNMDPLFPTDEHRLLSTLWSHHRLQRPENQLTGVGFLFGGYHRSHGQFMDGKAAFTVHRPDHWLFERTGLQQDDEFGGADTIVGYECDGCEFMIQDGLPVPTGRDGTPANFVILGSCPAKWHPDDSLWYDRFDKDRVGAAILGSYTRGGTVVTAGTTDWVHGLRGNDRHVVQITRNILDRLSK